MEKNWDHTLKTFAPDMLNIPEYMWWYHRNIYYCFGKQFF